MDFLVCCVVVFMSALCNIEIVSTSNDYFMTL